LQIASAFAMNSAFVGAADAVVVVVLVLVGALVAEGF
jgi:hypothetical protein